MTGAAVVDLAEARWRKEHTAAHEALRSFVVWEPWPHPSNDAPPALLELYKGLTCVGYARGWL